MDAAAEPSPLRRTIDHLSARGLARPWTAKPKRADGNTVAGPASLESLCLDLIAAHLHAIPSIENLPAHLMKEVLDRRKNEKMEDADLPFLLASTFEAVAAQDLDFLSLRSCMRLTDQGVAFVCDSCPALASLDLSFCELVGDESMRALSHACKGLHTLDLTGCRQVSDEGCQHIARLPALASLSLELCNRITDMGVQAVVRSAGARLQMLNLGDVRQMTNISVQLVGDHCPSLISLSIAGNSQAMDMDIGDVCKKAHLLQNLNLRACRRLTDGCLKPIASLLKRQHVKGIPPLRSLDLGGCSRITEDAFCVVLPLCSSLTSLDLRGCKQLTGRTKELIAKYCPEMQDLTFPPV